MKIGIIGAATVGMTLAAKLAAGNHDVLLASSRGPERLAARLLEEKAALTAASTAEAIRRDIVFLAVPWIRVRDVLLPDIAWNGRILVDTTNIFTGYAPDFSVDDLNGDSGSEIIARLAPGARVVKAFNTLPFDKMFAPLAAGLKRVLFVAGDDQAAVSTIADLILQFGLRPTAIGSLHAGGRQMELGGPLSGLELLTPAQKERGHG